MDYGPVLLSAQDASRPRQAYTMQLEDGRLIEADPTCKAGFMNDPLLIASYFAIDSPSNSMLDSPVLNIIIRGTVPPFSTIELILNYGDSYWNTPATLACLSPGARTRAAAFYNSVTD